LELLSAVEEHCTTAEKDSNAILGRGTSYKSSGDSDVSLIYGDYYYLESIVRATLDWTPYNARE
jgi:hypothetical protein